MHKKSFKRTALRATTQLKLPQNASTTRFSMTKNTGRLRRPHQATSTTKRWPAPSPQSRIDILLARLASASQLGLLLLAIFGYFYTVLPVYQKSLLDEEIAKKTLALNTMESDLRAKDVELQEKNRSLAKLNESVAKVQKDLGKSKAEIGNLRGKVTTQYSELRPRLAQDFQWLVASLCKLSTVPEGGLADCVESKVMPTANLVALAEVDRRQLLALIRHDNDAIHSSWRTFMQGIQRRKTEVQQMTTDATAKCEQQRASEDYKDRMKKISIDYQCSVDANRASSELIKIQIDEMFSGEKVLASALAAVARKFLSPTGAP